MRAGFFPDFIQGVRWVPTLRIADASGAFIDVSGALLQATWSERDDGGSVAGTFRLRREWRDAGNVLRSLAPLVSASAYNRQTNGAGPYAPLVFPFRRFEFLVTGRYENGVAAVLDYPVVLGVIDDPEFGGADSVVSVGFRDASGPLQDFEIRVARPYGAPAPGQPGEDVLEAILGDNGFPPVVAVLGNTLGWSLGEFTQDAGDIYLTCYGERQFKFHALRPRVWPVYWSPVLPGYSQAGRSVLSGCRSRAERSG